MADYRREWREYKQLKSLYVRVWLLGGVAVLVVLVNSGELLHSGLPDIFHWHPIFLSGLVRAVQVLYFSLPEMRKAVRPQSSTSLPLLVCTTLRSLRIASLFKLMPSS